MHRLHLESGPATPAEGCSSRPLFEADVQAAIPAERRAMIPRGRQIGSRRRTMRRALEHGWEHLQETEGRLG